MHNTPYLIFYLQTEHNNRCNNNGGFSKASWIQKRTVPYFLIEKVIWNNPLRVTQLISKESHPDPLKTVL